MLVGSSPHAAFHVTPTHSRTQFNVYSMMAAPLLIGSAILNLSAWSGTHSNSFSHSGQSPHSENSDTRHLARHSPIQPAGLLSTPLSVCYCNSTLRDLETYSNEEVLAVDQDSMGVQGRVVWSTCASDAKMSEDEAANGNQQRGLERQKANLPPRGQGGEAAGRGKGQGYPRRWKGGRQYGRGLLKHKSTAKRGCQQVWAKPLEDRSWVYC